MTLTSHGWKYALVSVLDLDPPPSPTNVALRSRLGACSGLEQLRFQVCFGKCLGLGPLTLNDIPVHVPIAVLTCMGSSCALAILMDLPLPLDAIPTTYMCYDFN